jgi:hypothetical protein
MAAYSAPGFVTYRGRPALEATSITVDADSGNKDVVTILKGRAGHTGGPLMTTINVDNAIPSTGPEVDWFAICASHDEIELGFKIAGDTFRFSGDVRTVKYDTKAEGTPNALSFTFHGTYLGTL